MVLVYTFIFSHVAVCISFNLEQRREGLALI